MSPAPGVGDDLAGEHQLEADIVGQRGEHGPVVDEGDGRQREARRRVDEERDRPLGVGGTPAVAEGEQSAAAAKPVRHRRRPRRSGRPHLSQVGDCAAARLSANLAWADAARSATRGSRRAPRLDEGVEEAGRLVGPLGHRLVPPSVRRGDGEAGVHQHQVAGLHRVDEASRRRSPSVPRARPRPAALVHGPDFGHSGPRRSR